ncbi:uncharacterized protein LOC144123955 [Amblyomma americanum]
MDMSSEAANLAAGKRPHDDGESMALQQDGNGGDEPPSKAAAKVWTSRTKLFLSVKKGGLGLAHLFLRQVVSRFMYLRDENDVFLRTVMQVRLCRLLPDLLVSSVHAREGTLWGFLKEVADTFNFLTVRFSLDYLYSLSRKQMTQALTESLFPTPLYRQPYLGSLDISVLKRVRRMCIQAASKTFFFKLHTATLPVKTFVNDKGMFVPWNVNCRLCNVPETIDHCFILCRDAMFFWDILQRTLKKDIEITSYTIRFLPVDKNSVVPYDVFVLMGLFSLWKSRMMDRHAEPPRSSKSVFREQCALLQNVRLLSLAE